MINYNIIDIINSNVTEENFKNIINKKLYKIIDFFETSGLNED